MGQAARLSQQPVSSLCADTHSPPPVLQHPASTSWAAASKENNHRKKKDRRRRGERGDIPKVGHDSDFSARHVVGLGQGLAAAASPTEGRTAPAARQKTVWRAAGGGQPEKDRRGAGGKACQRPPQAFASPSPPPSTCCHTRATNQTVNGLTLPPFRKRPPPFGRCPQDPPPSPTSQASTLHPCPAQGRTALPLDDKRQPHAVTLSPRPLPHPTAPNCHPRQKQRPRTRARTYSVSFVTASGLRPRSTAASTSRGTVSGTAAPAMSIWRRSLTKSLLSWSDQGGEEENKREAHKEEGRRGGGESEGLISIDCG